RQIAMHGAVATKDEGSIEVLRIFYIAADFDRAICSLESLNRLRRDTGTQQSCCDHIQTHQHEGAQPPSAAFLAKLSSKRRPTLLFPFLPCFSPSPAIVIRSFGQARGNCGWRLP